MRPVVAGLAVFGLLVVAHVVVWRLRRPAGQYVGLVALALGTLAASLVTFLAAGAIGAPGAAFLPGTALDYATIVVLYGALFLAYVTTYSAVQADSPSITILLRIDEAGERGLATGELLAELDDRVLVLPRLDDLVRGGLARHDNGRYVIGPCGALMARVHRGYRALLMMEKGG